MRPLGGQEAERAFFAYDMATAREARGERITEALVDATVTEVERGTAFMAALVEGVALDPAIRGMVEGRTEAWTRRMMTDGLGDDAALTGTIMFANVAMVIIPGQRRMVAAMQARQEPDPKCGRWGKQRSVHNTYLTPPVMFLMTSPHDPMT